MRGCVVMVALMAAVAGCRSVEYVPVPEVKVEREYVDRWRRDSVVVRDSVTVLVKGDTVWRDRWRTVWRERMVRDTVWRELRDSVTVVQEVPARLTRWQEWKMSVGGWAMVVVVAGVVGWVVRTRICTITMNQLFT